MSARGRRNVSSSPIRRSLRSASRPARYRNNRGPEQDAQKQEIQEIREPKRKIRRRSEERRDQILDHLPVTEVQIILDPVAILPEIGNDDDDDDDDVDDDEDDDDEEDEDEDDEEVDDAAGDA